MQMFIVNALDIKSIAKELRSLKAAGDHSFNEEVQLNILRSQIPSLTKTYS